MKIVKRLNGDGPFGALRFVCWVVLAMLAGARAHGAVALLMEEPYGEFGAFNPTGHAAVYLSHVCAETPTQLRMCRDGEYGSVISRYHKIDGLDWVAMPLIPYLYAVDDVNLVPSQVDRGEVEMLRETYRRAHLEDLVPDNPRGGPPKGEWTQLVGASYDRRIHGFQVVSTREQDERFIALFNDKKNVGHFNLLFHNCADFSRLVMDTYLPHAVHRNFIADVGLMTPKQAARSLVSYGKKHPEVEMSAFVIEQVGGTVPRSHGVDGVAESLVKSKKYLLPLAVLSPELAGGVVVAYLVDGRLKLPKDATVFEVDDVEVEGVPSVPGSRQVGSPARTGQLTSRQPDAGVPATSPPPTAVQF
jgi:hypothetical protein